MGVALSQAEELKLGVAASPGKIEAWGEPIMIYLAGALGRTVSLHGAKDDGKLGTQMDAGALDVGRA